MAYEALETLQETLDHILRRGDDDLIITPAVKQQIIPIRDQAVILQLNLKYFPEKEIIGEAAASTTNEITKCLFSDGGSVTNKLRELAERLESTAGNVVDYIKGKDSVSRVTDATTSKDVLVGLDEDLRSPTLRVVPIVGTGGIGKTTLAKIVYNDASSVKSFRSCGWVTMSQDYSVGSIALNLLASMKGISAKRDVERDISSQEEIRKYLLRRRYLIVIDDMCSKKAWDDIKMLFPDSGKGCRIIVTTRLLDVAAHVDSSFSIHTMHLLDAHHSWTLLKQKVFADKDYPLELEDIGKKIVKNVEGCPF